MNIQLFYLVPEKSQWLSDRERHIALKRVALEAGDCEYENVNLRLALRYILDWRVGVL